MGALSFLLGDRVVFSCGGILPFWWGIPLSSSWWSCGKLVFSSKGSRRLFFWGYPALLVGYPLSSSWWSCGQLVFSSRGSCRLFFWWYPALLVEYPLSSSWWSCGKLVFSSRGSCLLVGYPFILGFLFGSFGLLTFGALGLIRRSRCATALPAMDNVATACHVSGTASPFPPLQWEDAAGGSQSPAPVLHREGLSVGPLPTDDGQLVEPGGRPYADGTWLCGKPLYLQSCVRPASIVLFVFERVLARPGYTAQPGASFVAHVLSDGKTYRLLPLPVFRVLRLLFPFLGAFLAFAFADSRRFWPRPRTAFAPAHGTARRWA